MNLVEKMVKKCALIFFGTVPWVVLLFCEIVSAAQLGVSLQKVSIEPVLAERSIRVEATFENQLDVAISHLEIHLSCRVIGLAVPWQLHGRRDTSVAPGGTLVDSWHVPYPEGKLVSCTTALTGYRPELPSKVILRQLLSTGASADERAALIGVMTWRGRAELGQWVLAKLPTSPSVEEVRWRLLCLTALTPNDVAWKQLRTLKGLERLNQPLQLVLAAKHQGKPEDSPLAALLSSNISTMADAVDYLSANPPAPLVVAELFQSPVQESAIEELSQNETSKFYGWLALMVVMALVATLSVIARVRRKRVNNAK